MGNYNFNEDLVAGQQGEAEVRPLLERKLGPNFTFHESVNNSSGDLWATIYGTRQLIEVKTDFYSERSGNVAIEYSSRGKKSGISVSQASVWVYKFHYKDNPAWLYHLISLKKLREEKENTRWRHVSGGDSGSNTWMFIVPASIFATWGPSLN